MPEDSNAVAWRTIRLWLMAPGRQKKLICGLEPPAFPRSSVKGLLQGIVVNRNYLGFLRQILRTSDRNQDSWRSILRISEDDGLGKPKYFIILEKLSFLFSSLKIKEIL